MSNPFADSTEDPFKDPSVQGALNSNLTYEYHSDPDQSAVQTNFRNDDTATRLDEIRRRELELEQRERQLGQREEHVRNYGRNNWPPFYPLFFHDIDTEIPADFQADVRTIYRGWMFLVLVLIWNLAATIVLFVGGASDGLKDLGSAIFYLPVIGVLSFLLWYRPVYNAYAKEHSIFYILYFVFGGFHVAFCAYMVVGIPSTGSAGLINSLAAFARGAILTGVFGVIASAGWFLLAAGNAWMWRAVYKHWCDKGHTFSQAKDELASRGVKAYFGRGNNV